MLLWVILLFISSESLVGTAVWGKKEKELNNQKQAKHRGAVQI